MSEKYQKIYWKKEIDYAVYNCDATKYTIPDDVNVFYLPIVLDSGYKIIYEEKTDPVARYKYGSFALTN